MDVRIDISNNQLVIVAENGLGKTTIVNIIYYTLSRQWYRLAEYQFDRISFVFNSETLIISREELNDYIKLRKLRENRIRNQSVRISKVSSFILANYDILKLVNDTKSLEALSTRFEVPVPWLFDICNELLISSGNTELLQNNNLERISSKLNKELKAQILYLPTYRRIEKDLKNIFPDLETNLDSLRSRRMNSESAESNRYIELVEFGMEDVQLKVNQKLNSLYLKFTTNLRVTLMGGYLKDILNKTYEHFNYGLINSLDSEKLHEILNNIDETLLQKKEKEGLINFVENYKRNPTSTKNEDKIVAYFIQKLVSIYEQQSITEKDVISFIEICNIYCFNKRFIYSRDERKIKIYLSNGKEITFSKLSSGEKQIVSLFSHLYLSDRKEFFVIIDEPELSLSVGWQERLLPDILNAYCVGLIAVTHSPFIFSNTLEKHTKGFNEFLRLN